MEEKETFDFIQQKQVIENQLPRKVFVGGKTYNVRQVSQKVRTKIDNLAKEAWFIEKKCKEEMTLKKAQRLNRRLRSTHARIAAYYILGNWALFVPFLYALTWRWLELKNSETMFAINNAGANDHDTTFFFGNWEIIKGVLAISTKAVGDGIKDFAEREASAESMLAEDALPKKEEDGKSGVSSRSARRTRK